MRIATKLRRYGLGAMLAILTGGCQPKSFEHGDTFADTDSGESFGTFAPGFGSTGEFAFGGNYPQPAITRCGEVPGGVPAIQGLASAWAIVAVPGATANGDPVETGSVLLRISEQAIESCSDSPQRLFFGGSGSSGSTSFGEAGSDGTLGFELMLGPEELALGVHEVAALSTPEIFLHGEGAVTSTEASIELLHVDDDCIVGVVRGFVTDTGQPFMSGGFVAQTCQQQCIPAEGRPC